MPGTPGASLGVQVTLPRPTINPKPQPPPRRGFQGVELVAMVLDLGVDAVKLRSHRVDHDLRLLDRTDADPVVQGRRLTDR